MKGDGDCTTRPALSMSAISLAGLGLDGEDKLQQRVGGIDYDAVNSLGIYASSEYNCEDYGCNDDGICRCGRITGIEINPSHSQSLALSMFDDDKFPPYKDGENVELTRARLDAYAYTQILDKDPLDESDFYWSADSDYYGEELRSVMLSDKGRNAIQERLTRYHRECSGVDVNGVGQWLAREKYGKDFPKALKSARWSLKTFKLDQLPTSTAVDHGIKSDLRYAPDNGVASGMPMCMLAADNAGGIRILDGEKTLASAHAAQGEYEKHQALPAKEKRYRNLPAQWKNIVCLVAEKS